MRMLAMLLMAGFVVFAQQQEYKPGLLVFKDGRVIAMRGEYEVAGDEVHFTDGNGELMSIPLGKVDLPATDRRNQEIRTKAPPAPQEDDLVGQLEQYDRRSAKTGRGYESLAPGDRETVPGAPTRPPQNTPSTEPWTPTPTRIQDLFERPVTIGDIDWLGQKLKEVTNRIDGRTKTTFMILFGFLLLFCLISALVQVYLVVVSFGNSLSWGFGLLGAFLLPTVYWVLKQFFPAEISWGILGWLGLATNLLFPLVLLFYILLRCANSRLKLLFWWLAPGFVLAVILLVSWVKVVPILGELALI